MRGLTRTFGVSRTKVAKWLKKSHDNTPQCNAGSSRKD